MTNKRKIAAAVAAALATIPDEKPDAPQIAPAFLRPEQAAKRNGVCRRTLSNWTRQGLLPVHRVGKRITLYAVADLDAAIAKFRVGVKS